MGDKGRFVTMFDPWAPDGKPSSSSGCLVVIHHETADWAATSYRATFNDELVIVGAGTDPKSATMALADALEKLAARIREKAPPAFQMRDEKGNPV